MAVARALRPRGETPLVYSILQTPGDLKAAGGGTVILITDGEESCKGDIAGAAKTLKDSGLNLSLNIVGFTLKSAQAQAALGGLAESMGGRYYAAESGAALGVRSCSRRSISCRTGFSTRRVLRSTRARRA